MAVTSAVGVGLQAKSAYDASSAAESSAKTQNKISSKIGALDLQLAGESKKASAASLAIEKNRQKQMELDASRARRAMIRQTQVQVALSTSRANAQGALDSSSAQGGRQDVQTRGRENLLALGQNLDIGRNIFAENLKIYQSRNRSADIQTKINALGRTSQSYANMAQAQITEANSLGSLGQSLVQNAQGFGRVGQQLIGGTYPAQHSQSSGSFMVTPIWQPLNLK